jgi:hypothetical protein
MTVGVKVGRIGRVGVGSGVGVAAEPHAANSTASSASVKMGQKRRVWNMRNAS